MTPGRPLLLAILLPEWMMQFSGNLARRVLPSTRSVPAHLAVLALRLRQQLVLTQPHLLPPKTRLGSRRLLPPEGILSTVLSACHLAAEHHLSLPPQILSTLHTTNVTVHPLPTTSSCLAAAVVLGPKLINKSTHHPQTPFVLSLMHVSSSPRHCGKCLLVVQSRLGSSFLLRRHRGAQIMFLQRVDAVIVRGIPVLVDPLSRARMMVEMRLAAPRLWKRQAARATGTLPTRQHQHLTKPRRSPPPVIASRAGELRVHIPTRSLLLRPPSRRQT